MRLLSLTETKKLKDTDRDKAVQDGFRFKTETEKARREMLAAKAEAELLKKEIALSHDQYIESLQGERLALNAEVVRLREETREPFRRMAEDEMRLGLLRDEVRQDTVKKTQLMRQLIDDEERMDRRSVELEALERLNEARDRDIEERLVRIRLLEAEAEIKAAAAGEREDETIKEALTFTTRSKAVEKDLVNREAALATLTKEMSAHRKELKQQEQDLISRQKTLRNAFKELEKKRNR